MRRYIILDYIQVRINTACNEADNLLLCYSYLLSQDSETAKRYNLLARRIERLQAAYDKVSDRYYLA